MKNLKINRIYHAWNKWECLPMYLNKINISPEQALKEYASFLRNTKLFEENIKKVFKEWPISCEHFLSNNKINRIAWIGQSSMCIYSGIPQKYKGGFNLLTEKEKAKANKIAKKWLDKWLEKKYINI